ncbi:MAG: dTDP-4-dehydrorhamnose 3,5-epimerase [Rickettsiales bacterium]|jgi:dTDP-4-dehydrorhamnose 3,5-epimerase|nr:dTDP-4-dehydrorhamnose 3,5-epimerase [Rickettsiales bacterium]
MQFEPTKIDGVILIKPRVFADVRGYFVETYNQKTFENAGLKYNFVQDNQSQSYYGTIRGLHFQRGASAQAKLVRCLEGSVLDVAVDLRPGSPTYGRHISAKLTGENNCMLMIPRGFAHGFAVLSASAVFAYKCDNFYDPSADGGLIYNDPALGIDWQIPAGEEILSEKDKRHPLLKELGRCF